MQSISIHTNTHEHMHAHKQNMYTVTFVECMSENA